MSYRLGIDLGTSTLVAAARRAGGPSELVALGPGRPEASVDELRDPQLTAEEGTAALLVPYASVMQKSTGSWDMVLVIAAIANIAAAVLAIAVLKPWRARFVARSA